MNKLRLSNVYTALKRAGRGCLPQHPPPYRRIAFINPT